MTLLLGVDTGGTYTDAVLLDRDERIVASAKALTTPHDLSDGIAQAVDNVLTQSNRGAKDIVLTSLSTTLATNALVENRGGKVGLVLIGFDAAELQRGKLKDALRDDPVIFLAGGHDAHGGEGCTLDLQPLAQWLQEAANGLTGIAVTALFAVRNPVHEQATRAFINQHSNIPVTCSHELSDALDGPRRALTCLLNARLIGLIRDLVEAMQSYMVSKDITCPLMVVKGDGALMAADVAKVRPIETILSGPAASTVGAAHLSGLNDAVIADIGGTTTDIAVLRDGRPTLDPIGATVAGFHTMVEALAMHTVGIGGDSEVTIDARGTGAEFALGPRRVVPVSLLSLWYPQEVHSALDRQQHARVVEQNAARFVFCPAGAENNVESLTPGERSLFTQCAHGATALDTIALSARTMIALQRLVDLGVLSLCAFTPSDAAHALGLHDDWDADAASKAAELLSRINDGRAQPIATHGQAFSQAIVDTLVQRSAEVVLDTAFAKDGFDEPGLSHHTLTKAALEGRGKYVKLTLALGLPLVGLGAPAQTYYPRIAHKLNTTAEIPRHFAVANAVGAVVGRVRLRAHALVSAPSSSTFRVHSDEGVNDFAQLDAALAFAEEHVQTLARARAEQAGATDAEVTLERNDTFATIEGEKLFVEARIVAFASGRPRAGTRRD